MIEDKLSLVILKTLNNMLIGFWKKVCVCVAISGIEGNLEKSGVLKCGDNSFYFL
jgi:hypothetical protein